METNQNPNHRLYTPIRTVLLALLLAAGLPAAWSQTAHQKFTLTDGRLYWLDAENCDLSRRYPVAFDRSNGWAKVHPYGPQYAVTHVTERGDRYLMLDIDDPDDPKLAVRNVSSGFDPKCVWERTGTTGYYFQEWDGYRYYIVGTSSELKVVRIRIGDAIDNVTTWYDWDFGAGISEYTYRDGVRTETTHWIYCDTVGLANEGTYAGWKMTPYDCYQRPEDIIYNPYTPGDDAANQLNRWHYYSFQDAGGIWRPYGNGALFLPVTQIDHPIEIESDDDDAAGLQAVDVHDGDGNDVASMRHNDEATLQARIVYTDGGSTLTVPVRDAYTEYREETGRCGININYQQRDEEGFGSNGEPSVIYTHYYQNGVRIDAAPVPVDQTLTPVSVTYSINPFCRRFLKMYDSDPDEATFRDLTVDHTNAIHLRCYSIPSSNTEATLTAIVKYSFEVGGETYYVYDTATANVTVENYIEKGPDRTPVTAPVVYGYVVGGGRMANVGRDDGETDPSAEGGLTNVIVGGNTSITVHNCDTVLAIYGGNDIAGWVQGSATLQIGTLSTVSSVHIGYVYGGGCGYYSYENAYNATAGTWAGPGNITGTVSYGQYCFAGKVYPWGYTLGDDDEENEAHAVVGTPTTYVPFTASDDFSHGEKGQGGNGTVPYVKTSHVKVGVKVGEAAGEAATRAVAAAHNDLVHIDTLFGGAENAFIGVDADLTASVATGITIDIYGGTVMALFGGNNYGGSVAQRASSYITVYNTKLTDALAIENSYYSGYGRDFGIRHVFGGGNLVESAHAEVALRGGMVDTCFLGGNRASVVTPSGVIDCRGEDFIYDNSTADMLDESKDDYINLQAATISDADWEKWLHQNPGSYYTDGGRYNVRSFFGGNNKAPMTNLSYIQLRSGGACYVYGGGNEGDMNNSTPWDDDFYKRTLLGPVSATNVVSESNPLIINFEDSVNNSFTGWIYEKPGVIGSLVNSPAEARIIVENLYGGCRKANVEYSSAVSLSGGVFGYVQGGNDISGDIGSRHEGEGSWVVIDSNAIVLQDVYGGNDGFYHCHSNGCYTDAEVTNYDGNPPDYYHEYVGLPVPTQNNSNLYIHGGTILFSAYGGGVMSDVGFKNGTTYYLYDQVAGTHEVLDVDAQKGAIHFLMNGGTVGSDWYHPNVGAEARSRRSALADDERANNDGNAYGGGYLSSLYGLSYIKITSDTTTDPDHQLHPRIWGSLFAGNDCMGSTESFGRYKLPDGTYESFVASNGSALNGSNALFDAYVLLEGKPRITCVYGSGNGAYDYDGTRPEYSDMEPVCQDEAIDNRPFQSSVFVDIHTEGGYIDTVFGGGNGVGVKQSAEVLLNNKYKYNLERADSCFVGTIFGGNNRDDMNNCVPDIVLTKGTVDNVYGGGNAGSMKGYAGFTDVCGEDVNAVSSYVIVNSTDVHVANNLFGGCRMADVDGMAYIDIRATDEAGINYVYGGNDISGSINRNTRVDMSGGYVNHLYGGSNGYYDYENLSSVVTGDDSIVVWNFGKLHSELVAANSTGTPYVDMATVNLYGGTLRSSVYGGGRMGDCRNTMVVVDDHACTLTDDDPETDEDETTYRTLTINGAVYGGGEGYWQDLTLSHRGNTGQDTRRNGNTGSAALGATHVELRHATSLTGATAYGGGRGGDAYETYITVYDTWDQPFDALYGGCWGSDVIKATHVILNGTTQPIDVTATDIASGNLFTSKNIYGGNDYTGNVYQSEIIVNSGTYANIYGAGDGYGGVAGESDEGVGGIVDPTLGLYATQYADGYGANGCTTCLSVPNTENSTINFIDGRVTGNLYGGGKLGSSFSYQDVDGVYTLVNGLKVPDTSQTTATAYADPAKYTHVVTNIHGGLFDHNIYAGASGSLHGKALVYGLKVLNMDGGLVTNNIYGGSANVSDGYGQECVSSITTTERPSSIVNISAGTVTQNVYGGGYMGIIRGSTYINIGVDAIENSSVWSKTVRETENAYASFKPTMATLTSSTPLYIGQSVYCGPNWGVSDGSADFSLPGVYGGEGRLFIDGQGYNTSNEDALLPTFIIEDGSVIGAGTSAAGGDVLSRVDIRNYGYVGSDCAPTRSLRAIQRADEVWLHNTAIDYQGSTDAISPYLSNQVTLNRIGHLNCIGYNVVNAHFTITNIGEVNYYRSTPYPYTSLVLTQSTDLPLCYVNSEGGCAACDESRDDYICQQLSVIDRSDDATAYTAMVINNGINVDLAYNNVYSSVNGYAFLVAGANTNAIVMARPRYGSTNADDGGFMSVCSDLLQVITGYSGQEYNLTWCQCILDADGTGTTDADGNTTTSDCFNGGNYVAVYPYYNYNTSYRVWSLGDGSRRRYAVVQAHSNPDAEAAEDIDKKITLVYDDSDPDSVYNLAIAHSVLTLPPTLPGHYYKINTTYGIDLTDENEIMTLVDQSYKPTSWDGLTNVWGVTGDHARVYNSATDGEITITESSSDPGTYDTTGVVEPAANGELETLPMLDASQPVGINAISQYPDSYFGLMMVSGKYFATYTAGDNIPTGRAVGDLIAPTLYQNDNLWTGGTTISGNNHVNIVQHFTTAVVGDEANASPELDLYMLYDNRFSHTLIGNVALTLDEYEYIPKRNSLGQLVDADDNVIADVENGADVYREGYSESNRVYIEHNLNTPIQVEISLATILENFTDMDYELVAMYNEGRSNTFSRKVLLPATMQSRQLFLKGISWAPTTAAGAWLTSASNPTDFYLTDSESDILEAPGTTHNRFSIKLNVSDNISNNLTSSVGWSTKYVTEPPADIYTVAGYSDTRRRATGTDDDHYYINGTEGHTAIHEEGITTEDYGDKGILLGVLDGRGEAGINLFLGFDGRRIYGDGYVGKAVLHLVSYNLSDTRYENPNNFYLTVNVRTRSHGDTIYMASTPFYDESTGEGGIRRNDITLKGHNNVLTSTCGKTPDDYLHTFADVFKGPYQEGDVIAILDEVVIDNGSYVFIKGEENLPVNVIRYSGHHHEFPGENCAYRGTMITVSDENTSFTARNITFNGSMLTKTKPYIMGGTFDGLTEEAWKEVHYQVLDDYTVDEEGLVTLTYDKYADTLKASGPIIRVKDNATVTLQNGVTLERNYNEYSGSDNSLKGAVSVTGNGTLQLINNIAIAENMSEKLTGDTEEHPLNGAVYIDGGRLDLLTSTGDNTAILVKQNLQVDDPSHTFWKTETINIVGYSDGSVPVHYSLKDDIFDTDGDLDDKDHFSYANVYLTRTAVGTSETADNQTDLIYITTAPKPLTRVGISKWFPGATSRDTIQVVFQATGTQLNEAVYTNRNFFSDDDYYVMYNYGIDPHRVYLQRCATFDYQSKPAVATEVREGSGIYLDSVLQYIPRIDATCPTGGDRIVYRMKGGFYPYTYTWTDGLNGSGDELRTYTSPYTNTETREQLQNGNTTGVRLAVTDTLDVPAVAMSHTESERYTTYSVTANDVTGNCPRTKNVTVKLVKDIASATVTPFVKDNPDDWASTERPGNTATGTRTFKAIKITPKVWSDRSLGTIAAAITGSPSTTDSVYTEDEDGNHPIENMSFCEGDIIRLSTSPRYTTHEDPETGNTVRDYLGQFVMWDFSPFYSNPVAFVVPPTSTEVVAYYSPIDYWIQAIDEPSKAGAAYDNNYTYSTRPTVSSYTLDDGSGNSTTSAGYVTTYHGDVHIYNENGLAWFISVVNGLNGTQARPFYFNNVYLHQKTGGYDMKAHQWTPVGTMQHRFRGGFYGVEAEDASTEIDNVPVVISNILVNEPDMEHAGFFAFLDSAVVKNIKLSAELVRGSQYVGGLAASATHTIVDGCAVADSNEGAETTTILTTRYASGGLLGKSDHDQVTDNTVQAKYVGNAVYSGGVVGYGTSSKIYNNGARNVNRMSAVYAGGVAGYLDGTATDTPTPASKRRRSKSDEVDGRSYVMNNYVQYLGEGTSQRVGGLVGYAKNTVMENNYIYGSLAGESTDGGVGAILDSGATANHNYYENGATTRSVGQYRANATSENSSPFDGKGNQVMLANRSYGVNNLTRALNIWVREHGSDFQTWRSDLEHHNNGYPLFGTPDMIPVSDTLVVSGCDSVEWDGTVYLFDDEQVSHVVDSVQMIDSTGTLRIIVHHSSREQHHDSVAPGEDYSGYGFELSSTEIGLLLGSAAQRSTIVLSDTLQAASGCDSIITLTLTVNASQGIVETTPTASSINIYPNPATTQVTIEATDAMSHVELFDNEGRRLQDYRADQRNSVTIDVSRYATGAYYLRVHTADNVTIQKLIKK